MLRKAILKELIALFCFYFFIIKGKPSIVNLMGPTSVKLHGRAEFSCIIESKLAPTVTWHRNSLLVPQYPQRTIQLVGNTYESFLTIQNATVDDMAEFTCKVESMVVDTLKGTEQSRSMNVECKYYDCLHFFHNPGSAEQF